MTRRKRTLSYYQTHPRVFEQDLAAHDEAELERYLAEEELREPADDPPRVDPDYRMWLVDADDFKAR